MSSIGDRITTEFCKNRVAIRILQKPGQLMAAALPLKGLPSRVVEGRFDDIDAIAASPLAWDQEYEQIGRGRFQGQLTPTFIGQLQLGRVVWLPGVLRRSIGANSASCRLPRLPMHAMQRVRPFNFIPVSTLGHSRRFWLIRATSAIRTHGHHWMSEKCQKRKSPVLFDDLIGARGHGRRHVETDSFRDCRLMANSNWVAVDR